MPEERAQEEARSTARIQSRAVVATDDRVETFRGTLQGVMLRIEPDGRGAWQLDGTESELLS
jgi:hypothetical protein